MTPYQRQLDKQYHELRPKIEGLHKGFSRLAKAHDLASLLTALNHLGLAAQAMTEQVLVEMDAQHEEDMREHQ